MQESKMNGFFALPASRIIFGASIAVLSLAAAYADEETKPFIPRIILSSTIPMNGDLNPYGLAFVPEGFASGGTIKPGDVLVSNFNDFNNCQGKGTTIIKLTPNSAVAPGVSPGQSGNALTFFAGKEPGLTLALGVLRRGFVIVGNVLSTDCMSDTVAGGKLQVVDRTGKLVAALTDHTFFDSPWGLTVNDLGDTAQIFVANVLSGTVSRLDVTVSASGIAIKRKTVIAMNYTHRPDPAALVLGPTGLVFNADTNVLYVASTADNAIFAVPNAGKATFPVNKGTVVFADTNVLRGPIGLAVAPNGNLITSNGDAVNPDPTHPSEVVEFTPAGKFVRQYNIDPAPDGAFQVATVLDPDAPFNFAAVNDNNNTVAVYALPRHDDE
jgi:DNA-binding beta-propeller fold protein YncE